MSFLIRPATIDDIATIVHHRVSMFLDMGSATPQNSADLAAKTAAFLRDAIPRGDYLGWLASPAAEPSRVAAGAGVHLRRVQPFPRKEPGAESDVAFGRQALVVNVYTERDSRRRGFARRLMNEIIAWARTAGVESLVLHAAPDGRPLYEQLGFTPTNEMRYAARLCDVASHPDDRARPE